MSVIKAKLRQKAEEFISLRESLDMLVDHDGGCSLQDAASFLEELICRLNIGKYSTNERHNECLETGGEYFFFLLNRAKIDFEFYYTRAIFDCEDEYSQYVFRRYELFDCLASEGVHLAGDIAHSSLPPDQAMPQRLHQLEAENARLVEQVADLERRLKEAEAEPQQTAQDSPAAASNQPLRWPWGNHHTEALSHLEAAGLRFWQLFDPTDPTTAQTNEKVIEWLVAERRTSKEKARAIASLLRADGLPHGPRR